MAEISSTSSNVNTFPQINEVVQRDCTTRDVGDVSVEAAIGLSLLRASVVGPAWAKYAVKGFGAAMGLISANSAYETLTKPACNAAVGLRNPAKR